MSDKPSLYVVEKREVVVLVVLFVLVTVLSFTLGVRYGENVGRKFVETQAAADKAHGAEHAEPAGGTLGKAGEASPVEEAKKEKSEKAEGKAEEKADGKGHAEATSGEHGHGEGSSPEAAAKGTAHTAAPAGAPKEVSDKNSDEYLLNALKDAGVEPPGGKAPNEEKLPGDVKHAHSGAYVIQVGSHPTRNEAEGQVRQLKSHQVSAEILPAFKDKQGEWHRVVIGSFKSKHDAEKEAAGLKGRGAILSYFVWRLP
jgi:cell division protein FtsN